MLVSSIARFDAVNTMNNAAFASMQTTNSMMNLIGNAHTFGGEHDLGMLHGLDKKLGLDLATNRLLYKIAYLQEKMFAKMQKNELKQQKVDYLA